MDKLNGILLHRIVTIGGTDLTLGTILRSIFILLIAIVAAWAVRRIAKRMQLNFGEERVPTVYIGSQVLRYIVFFSGFAIAISSLGVDLSALSLFAGALGVGIGLGLQDIVRNFVCGIILLFDRSIEVGDFIELDEETRGVVVAIGPRATTVLTNDDVDIMVPNADLLNGRLKNWTRNRTNRRMHISFQVAYGTDKELVKQAVFEAAKSLAATMPDEGRQRTQLWLTGFGDFAMQFELIVWPSLEAVKRPGALSASYRWAIDDALRKYGIEIPVPQRELRWRGGGEAGGAPGRP
ncbi:MAG: mechanosensitive ion channel [Sphingobium sp.]|nr:mechanosensitive ion channel [Sphingobium sp.]